MSSGSSSAGPPGDGDVPHTRRQAGGARREATKRVTIRGNGFETTGWTLNVSRGGVRLVIEDPIATGSECELITDEISRKAKVVWTRNETDGQIAGLQWLDADGTVPPPPGDEPGGADPDIP